MSASTLRPRLDISMHWACEQLLHRTWRCAGQQLVSKPWFEIIEMENGERCGRGMPKCPGTEPALSIGAAQRRAEGWGTGP